MYFQNFARTVSRLAMIPLFILVLAGCGDDAGDTDAHVDEHEHEHAQDEHEHEIVHLDEFPGRLMVLDGQNYHLNVFDLESEEVVASFDDHDGFERGQAERATEYVRVTSDGRYGVVMQRTRNFSPTRRPFACGKPNLRYRQRADG